MCEGESLQAQTWNASGLFKGAPPEGWSIHYWWHMEQCRKYADEHVSVMVLDSSVYYKMATHQTCDFMVPVPLDDLQKLGILSPSSAKHLIH